MFTKHEYITNSVTYLIDKFKYFYTILIEYDKTKSIVSKENKEISTITNEFEYVKCENCRNTYIFTNYDSKNIYCLNCNQKVR